MSAEASGCGIGIALVGAGAAAGSHARAIAQVPGARLVRVHARGTDALAAFAARHGARPAASLDEVLADPAVRAVVVTTPSGTHAAVAEACAAAGRHVLCEKPLDVRLAPALRSARACRSAGVLLYPVFQNRFGAGVQRLLTAVTNGRIGEVLQARASVKWRRDEAYYRAAAWRGTWELDGGGCLMNQAIHAVDLVLALGGDPLAVSAFTANRAHPGLPVEDTATILVRHIGGALGVVEATTAAGPEQPLGLEVTGTRGTIILRGEELVRWDLADGSSPPAAMPGEPAPSASEAEHRQDKHRRQLVDFLAAIAGEAEPAITAEDGLRALATVEAAYASARSGALVAPSPWQAAPAAREGDSGGWTTIPLDTWNPLRARSEVC